MDLEGSEASDEMLVGVHVCVHVCVHSSVRACV